VISVQNLTVRLGAFSLEGVSFDVPPGEYGVLMGRTGSGKTTVLETICGLKTIIGGSIHLSGRDVTGLKPSQRGVGYVPQDGALFSTMTVWDHLAFAPYVQRWSTNTIAARVEELSEMLGIGHLLGRYPQGLSGGEAQRVALGRALACRPRVLCLDEPLSALDEQTRLQMYDLLKLVQRRTQVTILHVTHSTAEARALGDRLLVLEDGRVRQAPGSNSANGEPTPTTSGVRTAAVAVGSGSNDPTQ
jgi:molybdate/tungstate transport system ATP-binding protein